MGLKSLEGFNKHNLKSEGEPSVWFGGDGELCVLLVVSINLPLLPPICKLSLGQCSKMKIQQEPSCPQEGGTWAYLKEREW